MEKEGISREFLDAEAATNRLGVKASTLYAYVSRGLIRSVAHETDSKAHLYARADIEALVRRKARMRRPSTAAATALDWGMPVMESRITQIAEGRLFYRGHDVTALADTHSFESTARILWQAEAEPDPFQDLSFNADAIPGWWATATVFETAGVIERTLALMALLLTGEPPVLAPAQRARHGATLVLAMASATVGRKLPRPLTTTVPLHVAIAGAWGRPEAAEAIRRALVVCADHELNASTFACRVVASTGAGILCSLLAGVAALSGPKHGGTTVRVAAWLDEIMAAKSPEEAVRQRLRRGEDIVGFGHPLYPTQDPRAEALLAHLPLPDTIAQTLAAVHAQTGLRPTIDFALVAVERSYSLPAGAALALFALGRAAGWIAHAFEQQASNVLIRPRAAFVGTRAAPTRGRLGAGRPAP